MDSPTSIRSIQPPEILSPCGSQRRRSSCDSNPPEFEFWRLTNSSFPQPDDSDLLSADELFHDGVLLPLHLLSVKSELQSDPNISECDPDPSPSPSPSPAALVNTEEKPELEPGLGSELTRETTVSKRWRDIFRKTETKPPGKKEKVKESKKEKKKTGSGPGSGSGSGAELNINIWPFSRSRSAGNNVTRPRMSFGAPTTRKVSSAPCSRSNSTGESKSRKWPSSPGRNGVHLGRSSPVWQVRRGGGGAPVGKTVPEPTMGRIVGKREIPETRRGKTVIESNKAKVLNLNVPMCIGYRSRLSCRIDESGNSNIIGSDNSNNNNVNASNPNPNPNGLFGFRNLFVKKVY
ncbi:PREDICTED: uncharacterized protein LOC104733389 [Camelina sativa]|uniref:Uncharacterized protein LOC104733389 n=1 Tax=Camelina sativa TaxID=90675 RepID=A0ABM1QQB5_CAMSA|nr:PREDICTED: uncharacterized protein LOC104733389 [Camelina sativa]